MMRFAILATALVLAAAQPVSAAPQTGFGNQLDPFGFDFLHFMFKQSGLEPFAGKMRERDTVYVYLGRNSVSAEVDANAKIKAGGAVLFATDRGTRTRRSVFSMGRGPITVSNEAHQYQGHNDCVRVDVHGDHDVAAGLKQIIVNRSGTITGLGGGGWKTLANLPESGSPVLAVRDSENSKSRAIIMADHSPFTNDMLMHGDNALLAVNVVNHLSQGRRYIQFLVDGSSAQSGLAPMLPPDELPPIDPDDIPADTKMAIANRFLKEVERENALNRFLDSIPSRIIWRILIIAGTLLLSLYLLRKLLSSKALINPPALHAANSSEARAATMVRTKSLQPAAQELARDFLRALTGVKQDATAWLLSRKEIWVAPGVDGSARRIRNDIERLSRMATGSDRRYRVKPKELRKLAARIEELRAMVAAGQLRLERDYNLVRESTN